MVNILLTGASGYVGGQALHSLKTAPISSEISITCIVRDEKKASQILEQYPDVRVVPGDLEDVETIRNESSVADIVLHLASTGHLQSAQAISEGLSQRYESTGKPAHWIQMSGATLFAGAEIQAGKYGEKPGSTLDDLNDTAKLWSIIKDSPKRVVDNLVISQSPQQVKTALIVGPLIYGTGQGPLNRRSIQVPELAKVTLEGGRGVCPGDGLSEWCNVHIQDLGNLFVRLVGAAIEGTTDVWNENGVYIPENGVLPYKAICELVAQQAQKYGFIQSTTIDRVLSKSEADQVTAHGSILWGTNAAFRSSRARKTLGWSPSGPRLEDTIEEVVTIEAKRLGIPSR